MKKIYISEQKEKNVDGEKLLVVSVDYSKRHDTKYIAWVK